MNPAARRSARQFALQAIYQWQIAGTPVADIEADFLTTHIATAVQEKKDPQDKTPPKKQETDCAYFSELLRGVCSHHQTLDQAFTPFLNIAVSALDPVELAILRIATLELTEKRDVPWRVIINEALELTKRFGSVEGYKFVNGVLDRTAHKLRAEEISVTKKS